MADNGNLPIEGEIIHANDIINNYYTKSNVNDKYLFTKIKYIDLGAIQIPNSWKGQHYTFPIAFSNPIILVAWLANPNNPNKDRMILPRTVGRGDNYYNSSDTGIYLVTEGNLSNQSGWYLRVIVGDLA